MQNRFPTKARKELQLKVELKGDLKEYAEDGIYERSVNPKTVYRYRGALLRYQKFLGDRPPSLALSKEFLGSLRKIDIDPATLHVYSAVLKGYHEWRDEVLKFRVKVPETAPKYIPWEVIEKVLALASPKPHDELILRLMADAGLRRDEVINLKVSNLESKKLRLIGKGGKQRAVPMTDRLRKLVYQFADGKGPDDSVVDLGGKGIYEMVKGYGEPAGMPGLGPHDLRRAFGRHMFKLTKDIRVVQELLGHASVETTMRYIAITEADLEDAMKLANEPATEVNKKGSSTPGGPDFLPPKPILLEGRVHIAANPYPRGLKANPIETVNFKDFGVGVEASEIEILGIEVTNSDPDVACNLMLFADAATDDITKWDTRKIWDSGPVHGKFQTYKFRDGLTYKDFEKTNTLHGGLKIWQRPLRFDLPFKDGSREERDYYTKAIEIDVVVRYCVS